MSQSLGKISRFFLIMALVAFSLRPSAVNCQNPVVLNSGNSFLAHNLTCFSSNMSGTAEHISRRCSFINVESHDVFKMISMHKLIYSLFVGVDLFGKTTVLSLAVPSVFSSGLTPLRI
jgi:hypothetical protein